MKILVLNGPNLNLLGIREPEIYGQATYAALVTLIEETCATEELEVRIVQSNHEGTLVDEIQHAYGTCEGIVLNPAAYTHTSVALLDALKAVALPAVEVHISNVAEREAFRQVSYIREACIATIAGEGLSGYVTAIRLLKQHLALQNEQ